MGDEHQELRAKFQSTYDFGQDYPQRMLLSRIIADLDRPLERTGRPLWLVGLAAATAAVLVVAGAIWLAKTPHLNPPVPAETSSPRGTEAGLAAILANNRLVYVPPGATRPKWDISLAASPDLNSSHGYSGLGHRVASSPDYALIYALPAHDFRGGDNLVVVTAQDGTVVRRIKLPNPDGSARYGALAVGPSGNVWIVGSIGKRIEIIRVNARDWTVSSWIGRDMSHWVAKGPVTGDFYLYEVQVASDEQRAFYSYTGGLLDLAGLDWVDLIGQRAMTCTPPKPEHACIPGLAGFVVDGNDVYITTAYDNPSGAIDHYNLDGALVKHMQLGLLPGFLEDFAVTPDRSHIVATGSCGYSGGMAVIDLATQTSRVIVQAEPAHQPPTDLPCGQSSAFVSSNLIALGHVGALLPTDAAGQILFVDASSGKVSRSVPVVSEPIAIVALPQRAPVSTCFQGAQPCG
jgi:hypothetical protein